MYIDNEMVFSDSQALTVGAFSPGENVYDLGVRHAIGNGEPMAVVFVVDVDAVQTGGDEDYSFEAEYCLNSDQTGTRTGFGRITFESGTPTPPAHDADLLVAGYRFYLPVPPTPIEQSYRYLGVRYAVISATAAITCSSFLVPMSMIDATIDYPTGISIT